MDVYGTWYYGCTWYMILRDASTTHGTEFQRGQKSWRGEQTAQKRSADDLFPKADCYQSASTPQDTRARFGDGREYFYDFEGRLFSWCFVYLCARVSCGVLADW